MISSVDPVSGWVQQVVDRKDERAGKKRMQGGSRNHLRTKDGCFGPVCDPCGMAPGVPGPVGRAFPDMAFGSAYTSSANAPAGSNRSSHGGNEVAEAFD
jgi:hypothetical protein